MFKFFRFPFKESNSVTFAEGFLPGIKSSFFFNFFFFPSSTSSLIQDVTSAHKAGLNIFSSRTGKYIIATGLSAEQTMQ